MRGEHPVNNTGAEGRTYVPHTLPPKRDNGGYLVQTYHPDGTASLEWDALVQDGAVLA